jgi:branched-chain amino acid transport system permease protein
MTRRALLKGGLLAAGLAVLLAMPALVPEYPLNMVITMIIYSLFALSYNVLFGQAGLLSFGHAAYFGVGAYTALLLFKLAGLSLLPGILGAAVAAAILGVFLGLFVVRLGGTYFALLTLAFNALLYAGAEKWRDLTGGEDGVAAMRPDLYIPGFGGVEMFSTVHWYYFVLIVVLLSVAFCWHFTRTPLGRLNECLRENEDRARFIGYNIYTSKVAINVISAFFAGLAGGLAGAFQEFVTVTFINLDKASEVLIMTFVGGSGTFWGPILGACFLTYLNQWLSDLTEHWTLIQGVIFVLLVMYAPQGISGLLISIKDRLVGFWASRPAAAGAGEAR